MKKVVWFLGILLLLSFVFPNGVADIKFPVKPPVVAPDHVVVTDPTIVKLLQNATDADRGRVQSIYTGLKTVVGRDNGELVNTTERFAVLHANTLKLAVEQVNKYPGLDVAINEVIKAQMGTDEVVQLNADTVKKLVTACDIIADSAVTKSAPAEKK
jgi:hypothetical protein